MKIRNLPGIAAGVCALALLSATGAQAQSTWTCKTFADSSTLGAKVQTLTPDAQLSAKIVVRQFQSVTQLKAATTSQAALDGEDTVAGAKPKIPGTLLGQHYLHRPLQFAAGESRALCSTTRSPRRAP